MTTTPVFGGTSQGSFEVASRNQSTGHHIVGSIGMKKRGTRSLGFDWIHQWFQLGPRDRECGQIQLGVGFGDDGGYGFTHESGFGLGKHWLISHGGYDTELVDPGDVLGGECGHHSRSQPNVTVQVAKLETGPMMG